MKALKPTTPRPASSSISPTDSGNQAAPQPEVGDGRGFERRALAVEFARVHRARRRVERHVEEHCSAARGQRPAAGGRAFPFGAARLVEMQMDVDHGRKHVQPARVDLLRRTRKLRAIA